MPGRLGRLDCRLHRRICLRQPLPVFIAGAGMAPVATLAPRTTRVMDPRLIRRPVLVNPVGHSSPDRGLVTPRSRRPSTHLIAALRVPSELAGTLAPLPSFPRPSQFPYPHGLLPSLPRSARRSRFRCSRSPASIFHLRALRAPCVSLARQDSSALVPPVQDHSFSCVHRLDGPINDCASALREPSIRVATVGVEPTTLRI